jgi:uncharacterized protein with PQ loop repeat
MLTIDIISKVIAPITTLLINIGFINTLRNIYKNKNAENISVFLYLMMLINCSTWLVYDYLLGNFLTTIDWGICVTLILMILIACKKYKK